MKKFSSFFIAAVLVAAILLTVVADVNHGHGPGHGEDSHGSGSHGGEVQLEAAH